MEYQFKQHFAAVYKMLEEEGSGVIRVKASSYGNEDVYGDVFQRGAFDKSISRISKSNKIPMLFNHNSDAVIGNWYKAWDDDEHLYMEGRLDLGHSIADDVYINLKSGSVSGSSIGFNSDDAEERRDEKGNYLGMLFKSADVMENSICVFQANPKAGVDNVKSITRIREFEKSLIDAARDAGVTLSRRDVEKLSQSVWPKLGKSIEREADTDDGELVKALRAFDPLKI